MIRKLYDRVKFIDICHDCSLHKKLVRNLEIYQYYLILRHDMHCNSRENKC